MLLHVTFSDGSNPGVFYGDRHQVAAHWRRWMKHHSDTAKPQALIWKTENNWRVRPAPLGGYMVMNWDAPQHTWRIYKTLGHALAALERLGETK